MRACTVFLSACLLLVGCTANAPDTMSEAHQGIAEVHVAAPGFVAAITRVTVDAGGQTQDLVLDPMDGSFNGSLLLPAGPQTVVARAFAGDVLAGASNPVTVAVQASVATRITLRIIDLRVDQPVFGPIFDSSVVPSSASAGVPVVFSVSVVAPAGDPVDYQWASTCADSVFSAPTAASTSWSSASPGSCRIDLTATSNGFSISQSFVVVVFAAGAQNGALTVDGEFIAAPALSLVLSELGCAASSGGGSFGNASCSTTTAQPAVTTVVVSVLGWGLSTPGPITVTDNCGGRIGFEFGGDSFAEYAWLPPVAGGVCIVTVQAVNGDGAVGSASLAVLVRPGTPATSSPPLINAGTDTCFFSSSSGPSTTCFPVVAGSSQNLFAGVDYRDGHPGTLTVSDDCGGGILASTSASSIRQIWRLPSTPGALCTLTVTATSLEGTTSVVQGMYPLQ